MTKPSRKFKSPSPYEEDKPYRYSDLQSGTYGYSVKEARRKVFEPEGGLFGNV